MKKSTALLICLLFMSCTSANAQVLELIRLVTTEVIKAMDLQIQKQQNIVLAMQVTQRQIENNLSENKLADIEKWMQKQNDLYQEYYGSLKKVSATVKGYQKIGSAMAKQKELLMIFQKANLALGAVARMDQDQRRLIAAELEDCLSKSFGCIQRVVTASTTTNASFSDAARIAIIRQSLDELNQLFIDINLIYRSLTGYNELRSSYDKDTRTLHQLNGL